MVLDLVTSAVPVFGSHVISKAFSMISCFLGGGRPFLHLNCSTRMRVGETARSTEVAGDYSGKQTQLNFMFSLLLEGEVGKAREKQARYTSALIKRKSTPGSFHTASDSAQSTAAGDAMQHCEGQHLRHNTYKIRSAHPHAFPSSTLP